MSPFLRVVRAHVQESRIGEQMNSCEMKTRREGPNSVKVVPVIEVKIIKGIGIEGIRCVR